MNNLIPSSLRRHEGLAIGTILLIIVLVLLATAAGVFVGARWSDRLRGATAGPSNDSAQSDQPKQLWTCGMHPQVIREAPGLCPICEMDLTPVQTDSSSAAAGGERAVKYWWDPMMNPPYLSREPGKSPMGMDLIPVYEDEIMSGPSVTIDPVVVQNMGVRVAAVVEGPLRRTIRATGILTDPQPNITDITLRVSGFIEKLHADADGKFVNAGDPLLEIYSPDLQIGAQELLTARRALESLPPDAEQEQVMAVGGLMSVARRKLSQWGLRDDQIEALAQAPMTPRTITLLSPVSGYISEKMVSAGASVEAGERLMRIVDRSTLWLDVRLFEQHVPFVQIGQKVQVRLSALSEEPFDGDVSFVDTSVDETTRSALVRLTLNNPEGRLKSGMFATASIAIETAERAIMVPREAVIDTGDRQVAFIAQSAGHFEPRKVAMGARGDDGMVQILSGLVPGEAVVVSGQFLLDSESRLKEAIQKHLGANLLQPADAPAAAPVVEAGSEPTAEPIDHALLPEVDALFAEYLKIADALGKKQAAPDPFDPSVLIAAANRLAEQATGDLKTLAQPVADAAVPLTGQTLDEQRVQFKKVSDAMIALAPRAPPSKSIAEKLYIAYCPMAPGSWLQTQEGIANPYYATAMKKCGEIKGTIATGAAAETLENQP